MMEFGDREFPGMGVGGEFPGMGHGYGWRRRLQHMATASGMPGFGTLPTQIGGKDWFIGNDPQGNFRRALDAYGHGGTMPSFGTLPLPQFGTGSGSRLKPVWGTGFQAGPAPLSFGTLPIGPVQPNQPQDREVSIPRMRGM